MDWDLDIGAIVAQDFAICTVVFALSVELVYLVCLTCSFVHSLWDYASAGDLSLMVYFALDMVWWCLWWGLCRHMGCCVDDLGLPACSSVLLGCVSMFGALVLACALVLIYI